MGVLWGISVVTSVVVSTAFVVVVAPASVVVVIVALAAVVAVIILAVVVVNNSVEIGLGCGGKLPGDVPFAAGLPLSASKPGSKRRTP